MIGGPRPGTGFVSARPRRILPLGLLLRFAECGAHGIESLFGEAGSLGDHAVVPLVSGGGPAVDGLAGALVEVSFVGHGAGVLCGCGSLVC